MYFDGDLSIGTRTTFFYIYICFSHTLDSCFPSVNCFIFFLEWTPLIYVIYIFTDISRQKTNVFLNVDKDTNIMYSK